MGIHNAAFASSIGEVDIGEGIKESELDAVITNRERQELTKACLARRSSSLQCATVLPVAKAARPKTIVEEGGATIINLNSTSGADVPIWDGSLAAPRHTAALVGCRTRMLPLA